MQKTKLKHNKKRNTAFLFESLIKELTKAVMNKDQKTKNIVLTILKENFRFNKTLGRELDIYKSLYETRDLNKEVASRMINEAKRVYSNLNQQTIFQSQSNVINDVNKKLSPAVFSNFMSNYKDLATIAQIFDQEIPMRTRVLLEQYVIDSMSEINKESKSSIKPIDNIVYREFTKKFNDKYSNSLLPEQKNLLSKYITSFSDNEVDFKVYLNEEIARIKALIKGSNKLNEQKNQDELIKLIENFRHTEINSEMIEKVLKLQSLVREIE